MFLSHSETLYDAVDSIMWWFREQDGGLDFYNWVKGSWEAETFGVEFDDWADQEMLTHGKTVSFKDWAKEEGKKHGDMDLTDWAEEEEESHDERYGAEEFLPNGVLRYYGKTIKEGQEGMFKGAEVKIIKIQEVKKHGVPSVIIYEYLDEEGNPLEIKGRFGMKTRDSTTIKDFMINFTPFEPVNPIEYGAEEGAFYHLEVKYNMEDGWEHYGDYDDKQDAINAYYDIYLEYPEVKLVEVDYEDGYVADEIYSQRNFNLDAETFESPAQLSQRPHIYQHNGVQYQIKRNSYKPTGNDLMADIDFTNDKGEWIETIETDYHANIDEVHNDAQRIIDEYKDKSDKPSLKSVGLLLGVGALATYFAPKSMRDFLNRLK
jgi:hypothetical protein